MPVCRALVLLFACSKTPAQRAEEATRLASQMQQEIVASHKKFAREFQKRPDAEQVRSALGEWFVRNNLSDLDGLSVSADLQQQMADIQSKYKDGELVTNIRLYMTKYAKHAIETENALERDNKEDTNVPWTVMRTANKAICHEDSIIAQKYIAKLENLSN